jgi:hypothetical protein
MMNKTDELKDRVEARKHELLSRYNELKADSRHEAIEMRSKLKLKLDELEREIEHGWERVDDTVRAKLNRWLERD